MSSLALMRWLEATPGRYDAGMRVVTLGRVASVHDAVAQAAVPRPGLDVLEIGCGTGSVTGRLLERGARVTALDQSPAMIEQARLRLGESACEVSWLERTASEIDSLPKAGFDAAVMSLCLSEMSADERRFVLAHVRDRLREGGRLVVADEVRAPGRGVARALQSIGRAPQWLLGWLLAGSVSHPLADLPGELAAAGFHVEGERRWLLGTLAVFVALPAGGDVTPDPPPRSAVQVCPTS